MISKPARLAAAVVLAGTAVLTAFGLVATMNGHVALSVMVKPRP